MFCHPLIKEYNNYELIRGNMSEVIFLILNVHNFLRVALQTVLIYIWLHIHMWHMYICTWSEILYSRIDVHDTYRISSYALQNIARPMFVKIILHPWRGYLDSGTRYFTNMLSWFCQCLNPALQINIWHKKCDVL